MDVIGTGREGSYRVLSNAHKCMVITTYSFRIMRFMCWCSDLICEINIPPYSDNCRLNQTMCTWNSEHWWGAKSTVLKNIVFH